VVLAVGLGDLAAGDFGGFDLDDLVAIVEVYGCVDMRSSSLDPSNGRSRMLILRPQKRDPERLTERNAFARLLNVRKKAGPLARDGPAQENATICCRVTAFHDFACQGRWLSLCARTSIGPEGRTANPDVGSSILPERTLGAAWLRAWSLKLRSRGFDSHRLHFVALRLSKNFIG
jgi:hypothetical protein